MRYILALAFVVCLSNTAAAQEPLVIASLSKQFREGTHTTASYDVPITIAQTGARAALLTLDLDDSAYEDPTTRITIRIYRLLPGGGWEHCGSTTKVGGRYVEDGVVNPPITLELGPISAFAGFPVRAEIESATRVRVGLSVELVP